MISKFNPIELPNLTENKWWANFSPRSDNKCFPSHTCYLQWPFPGVEICMCFLRAKCETAAGRHVMQPELSPCVLVYMWSRWTCAPQVFLCYLIPVQCSVSFKFTTWKLLLHRFNSQDCCVLLFPSFFSWFDSIVWASKLIPNFNNNI